MKPILALRNVGDADLPVFLEHQKDPESVHMAAFVFGDPGDRAAFYKRWARLLASRPAISQASQWKASVRLPIGSAGATGAGAWRQKP